MRAIEDAFGIAVRTHQAGDWQQAAVAYQEILRQEPNHAGAWHLFGVAAHQAGDFPLAEQRIRRAIRLDASKGIYFGNLGAAIMQQGRLAEAEACLRKAIAIRPVYPDAIANLAAVSWEQGRYEEAARLFDEVLRLQPNHWDALTNLAGMRLSLGQTQQAVEICRKVLAAQPGRPQTLSVLADALWTERRLDEAASCYEQAVSVAPQSTEARLNLAIVLAEQGHADRAERWYQEACQLRPDRHSWPLKQLGVCPVVFAGVEEMDTYRTTLEARLDALLAEPVLGDWRELASDGVIPPFQLPHHGRDNRTLLEKFSRLFTPCFPQRRPERGSGRPRIGFLVTSRHEGGFLRGAAGLIEQLDPAQFDVAVLASYGALPRCRQAVRRSDVGWVGLSNRLETAVNEVAAAGCDILYHWQVGTDPLNYFLPFARGAPIQCTSWGTHGTSGLAQIDYYLSSQWIEAEGADDHYSEALVRLKTLPTYQRRPPAPRSARRAEFGLPESGTLYFCLQRMAKFHPDSDALFGGVLREDPQGYLVLLAGSGMHARDLLRQRMARTLGRSLDRVVFVPIQPFAEYLRLLSLADVVLDPAHYSAGLTAYDAFSQAIPIVTLPDAFSVGRYALACYRKMGLDELVPASLDQYVALAARLGKDREYRHSVRSAIAERCEVLFEDRETVREHERFFAQALLAPAEIGQRPGPVVSGESGPRWSSALNRPSETQ